ncbi:MAG: peptidyl-prolyl cis-trans isomerase, partial [Sedimentisphaerales bacterium]|nr:peptidyl-prolyl cis-trans isomerase [Sedimentisphaerales bacterium]
ADEAKKKDADFQKLYEKYTKQQDKSKGLLKNMSVEKLKAKLGEEATTAVQNAKKDDVLGPFIGVKGFEIIKVTSIKPPYIVEFNKARPGILAQMTRQMKTDMQKKAVEEIKAKAEIVKSEEIIDLEKQAEKAKSAPKGPGK